MALRQLTDAPGLIIEADRSFSVELPGPSVYSSRAR